MLALGLVASGCNAKRGSQAASTASAAPALPALAADGEIVSADAVDAALHDVANGPLSRRDRDAFARFMAANRHRPEAYDGKTVRQIVNFEVAYENGIAEDARNQARDKINARVIAGLIDARVLSARDGDRQIIFRIVLRNKTSKTMKHADVGLVVTDAASRKAVGHIELNIDRVLAPHATATFDFPVRYASFGSDTATMIAAGHRPKTFAVEPDHVVYTDGSDAGEAGD
jgi:hypothetical protein